MNDIYRNCIVLYLILMNMKLFLNLINRGLLYGITLQNNGLDVYIQIVILSGLYN